MALNITRFKDEHLTPDRIAVQNKVIADVQADPEQFLKAYREHRDSHGGRYVCADLMKEVVPEYAASKEARGRYNNVVHNAAATLAAEQYSRVVADRREPERDRTDPRQYDGPAGVKVWREELSHGPVLQRINAEADRRARDGLASRNAVKQFRSDPSLHEETYGVSPRHADVA